MAGVKASALGDWQGDLDLFFGNVTDIPKGTGAIAVSIDGGQFPLKVDVLYGPRWQYIRGETELDVPVAIPIVYPQNVTLYYVNDPYWGNRESGVGPYPGRGVNQLLDAIDGSYCTYEAFGEKGDDPNWDPHYPDARKGGYKGKLQCGTLKPPNVISISWGTTETNAPAYFQKRQCNEWLKLGLQGVSVFQISGDYGVDCVEKKRVFTVNEASNCPWVTSVGGTMLPKSSKVSDPEVALDHADVHSGGGFSILYDAPDYQKSTLKAYFRDHNPPYPYFTDGKYNDTDGRYNRNGRGVPDLSAVSAKWTTWIGENWSSTSGTSASTPLVASIFTLVNETRLRAHKGLVGFVNPTLYAHPKMLTDIVEGSNPGLLGCKGVASGFDAVEGWDPVTGLGTPDYEKVLEVFMKLP